jgi:hypothetical protein
MAETRKSFMSTGEARAMQLLSYHQQCAQTDSNMSPAQGRVPLHCLSCHLQLAADTRCSMAADWFVSACNCSHALQLMHMCCSTRQHVVPVLMAYRSDRAACSCKQHLRCNTCSISLASATCAHNQYHWHASCMELAAAYHLCAV